MQYDDSFGDQSTKEYTRNPFGPFQSQLEQTVTKGFGMWCSQVRAEHNHSSSEHDISRRQRIGQAQDLGLHDIAVIGDPVIHPRGITNMLFSRKREINYLKRDSSHVGIRGDRCAREGSRRRNQIYRAQRAVPFRRAIENFLSSEAFAPISRYSSLPSKVPQSRPHLHGEPEVITRWERRQP